MLSSGYKKIGFEIILSFFFLFIPLPFIRGFAERFAAMSWQGFRLPIYTVFLRQNFPLPFFLCKWVTACFFNWCNLVVLDCVVWIYSELTRENFIYGPYLLLFVQISAQLMHAWGFVNKNLCLCGKLRKLIFPPNGFFLYLHENVKNSTILIL